MRIYLLKHIVRDFLSSFAHSQNQLTITCTKCGYETFTGVDVTVTRKESWLHFKSRLAARRRAYRHHMTHVSDTVLACGVDQCDNPHIPCRECKIRK